MQLRNRYAGGDPDKGNKNHVGAGEADSLRERRRAECGGPGNKSRLSVGVGTTLLTMPGCFQGVSPEEGNVTSDI